MGRVSARDKEGLRLPGEPLLAFNAYDCTTVVALAVLLDVFESPGVLAVAVFVVVPFCVGLITIVTVAEAAWAIVPRLHVTVRFAGFRLQLP